MSHSKITMNNCHQKYVENTDSISVDQKSCHIELLTSIKSLKSITLYTQIYQLWDNQSQNLLRPTIFLWKSTKNVRLALIPRISLPSWLNLVASLGKLCDTLVTELTCKQGRWGSQSHYFCDWLSPKLRKFWRGIFNISENFFDKLI